MGIKGFLSATPMACEMRGLYRTDRHNHMIPLEDIVETLARSHEGQSAPVADLPGRTGPLDLATAYEIQTLLVKRLGLPVTGWKLAVATPAAQQAKGLSAPTVGRLIGTALRRTSASFSVASLNRPEIEPEIALTLSRDILPDAPLRSRDEALSAISVVHLAIELADSRYLDKPGKTQLEIIADNNAASHLILGAEVEPTRLDEVRRAAISVQLGDGTLVPGFPSDSRPDPLDVLVFLSRFAAEKGLTLASGQVITTGTCAAPTPATVGDNTADFGRFGSVSCILTD